jgi:hypothetical protein
MSRDFDFQPFEYVTKAGLHKELGFSEYPINRSIGMTETQHRGPAKRCQGISFPSVLIHNTWMSSSCMAINGTFYVSSKP